MSALADKWRELGRAIEQCADHLEVLTEQVGDEVFLDDTPTKWPFFENHDLVMGNPAAGYIPTPVMLELASLLSLNHVRKQVAPDLDDWLGQLEKEVSLFHSAQAQNNYRSYQRSLQNIQTLCWTMIYGLQEEIKGIDYFIQTQFGHVQCLKDKQIENKYCIEKVCQYAEKLTHIKVSKLNALAHNNPDLSRIFFSKLVPVVEECREKFKAALPQLRRLLWTYRKQDQTTKSLWAVSRHFAQGGQILKNELPDETLMASPFNHNAQESLQAHPMLNDEQQEEALIAIVKNLSQRESPDEALMGSWDEDDELISVAHENEETIELEVDVLNSYLLAFVQKATEDSSLSAKIFWIQEGEQSIPLGVWLLWSSTELEKYQEIAVQLLPERKDIKPYEGNIWVEDFTVSFSPL